MVLLALGAPGIYLASHSDFHHELLLVRILAEELGSAAVWHGRGMILYDAHGFETPQEQFHEVFLLQGRPGRGAAIVNLDLRGPAGRLEAILDEPKAPELPACAVVCHPHPLFGGTSQNKVTYRIAQGLWKAGYSVLRFNFRGAGRSEGEHDGGVGEVDDLRAAVAWLMGRTPGARLLLAGYSFGAYVASVLFAEDARPEALIAVGPAVRVSPFERLYGCGKPKHLIVAERDEFGPPEDVRPVFDRMAHPKRLDVIARADHSFSTALTEVEGLVHGIGAELLAPVGAP